ncbi:MAG: GTPase RsgA, partial [Firmicutes bacterium]|nr:GTPase RsgA [Bacillota bacterium]
MRGVILKGIGGFYYVLSEGRVYACKARGIFRKLGMTPLAGDKVVFSLEEGQVRQDFDGTIDEIEERLNCFDRPPVANVETMVIVMAARDPLPSFGLLDRFIVSSERAGARTVVCVNKTDLAE